MSQYQPEQPSSKTSKLWIPLTVALVAVFALLGLFLNINSANAANLSEFQAGNIMSDAIMGDKGSMTESQIQTFLKSKNSCNDTNLSRLTSHNSTSGTLTSNGITYKYYLKDGHFVCMADQSFGGESAAHIIYQAAQDYSVNPRVLIVLLQKEQGLVTDTWPNYNHQFAEATGYMCPDTPSGCNSEYAGFKTQVRNAASLFHSVLTGGWSNYPVGVNYIQYNPATSCGGSNVNIENRATSALYRYTPYQPNKSALNAGYGNGDSCGAYGNRNFWLYFTDWFGSTTKGGSALANTTHPDGSLITLPGSSAVYLIINQELYHVPSLSVFSSRHYKWSSVASATYPDQQLPVASDTVAYASGTLVRGDEDNSIYLLECSSTSCAKLHVTNADVFRQLSFDFNDVLVLPQATVDSFADGTDISSPSLHPKNTLVLDSATKKVYQIGNGQKNWVASLNIFDANRFSWSQVLNATSNDLALADGPNILYPEGVLIKSTTDPATYVIDINESSGNQYQKRHIANQAVFAGLGYKPNQVYVDSVSNLPTIDGSDVTQ